MRLNWELMFKIRINFDPEKQNEAFNTMNYLIERFNKNDHLKIYFAPIDADNEIR